MEKPNGKGSNNFVVGLFIFVAFLVLSGFIVFMGGSSPFGGEGTARAFFRDIRGLNIGAPVFFSGIQVGRVRGYEFPTAKESAEPGQDVGVFIVMGIFGEHKDRIRSDAVVTIATQGVLGDKVIVIKPGSGENSKPLTNNMNLASVQPQDLGDYFKRGGDLVENLNQVIQNLNLVLTEVHSSGRITSILTNLDKASASFAATTADLEGVTKDDMKVAVKSLRHVMEKIDKGEGTLGALINDPSLHEDLRVLVGGAQRSKVVRFLIREAISSKEKQNAPEAAPAK